MSKLNLKWLLLLPLFIFSSCTDLEEELFDSLSPTTFYQNEDEALASVVGVYQQLSGCYNYGRPWRGMCLGTDEFLIAARTNGGWYDGGQFHQFTTHTFDKDNDLLNRAWQAIFGVIGASNAVMQSLEESPTADKLVGPIAEVRALRAMAYYLALDWWGNVPIFTDARVDPSDLPTTDSRSDVFDFVEQELIDAAADLPSISDVDRASYYPRLTKEAAYTALAKLYLNAEVYTGTAKWAETITMCNNVMAKEGDNGYKLENVFLTSFDENNYNSKELLVSFSIDPGVSAGANNYFRGAMHPDHAKVWETSFEPAGGYSTLIDAFNRYTDDNDIRKTFIIRGPQFYKDGVTPLIDTRTNVGQQLVLIPFVDYTGAELNEGYRVLKYVPGAFVGRDAFNDIVMYRYADILMMKAEALMRSGGSTADAMALVNRVRERAGAAPFTTGNFELHDILDERGREFIWEGCRRTDMIRFGDYFTGTWKFKTTQTPTWRGIFPIPNQQMISNPNLDQNPNYAQ